LQFRSAYSLSGHVTISLTSSTSLFEWRRVTRLVLQSLVITFEGQSELITARTGYVPIRLCSVTRELAPGDGVEISNEGHEDSGKPCVWNVVFNLPIPGWLPASSSYGLDEDAGTGYLLYATAKFANLDDRTGSSCISYICWPFSSQSTRAESYKRIIVNRYMDIPPATLSYSTQFPVVNHAVQGPIADTSENQGPPKVEVLASVPEFVDVNQPSLPFTVCLRTLDMDESEPGRLQVTSSSVELNQIETYMYAHSRILLNHS
jgi:hypothetical protein